MSATEGGVDHVYALEQVGGDRELLIELIELFVGACSSMLRNLEEAVATADPDAIQQAAHLFKGSFAQFGAFYAADLCGRLESMGRQGDVDGALSLLPALREETERVLACLEAFVEE